MCLLIFAHRVYPGYPLVLAANRDEYYARPTAISTFWPDNPRLLAGRDLEAGGTWMGITRQGRFAAITNYRDPTASANPPHSRGELPLDFLNNRTSAEEYLANVAQRAHEYAGYNLLLGEGNDLWHYNNQPQGYGTNPAPPHLLKPGIYGLSNANLNTPWPKVELGKARLLKQRSTPNHDALLSLVNNRQQASTEELNLQGMETVMEQVLSAQFILAGEYGTRSSTTMWVDDVGNVSWRELTFDRWGEVQKVSEEAFTID